MLIKCQMIISICFQFDHFMSVLFILDEPIVQLTRQKWSLTQD